MSKSNKIITVDDLEKLSNRSVDSVVNKYTHRFNELATLAAAKQRTSFLTDEFPAVFIDYVREETEFNILYVSAHTPHQVKPYVRVEWEYK